MSVIAFDDAATRRAPQRVLSRDEKAMLFDHALMAMGRHPCRADALAAAPLIAAFAAAYVAIRDREEGIV
jgi:hypothetical protein